MHYVIKLETPGNDHTPLSPVKKVNLRFATDLTPSLSKGKDHDPYRTVLAVAATTSNSTVYGIFIIYFTPLHLFIDSLHYTLI